MYRYHTILQIGVVLICMFFLFSGCEQKAEQPKKRNVVSKPIPKKEKKAPVARTTKPKTDKTKPVGKTTVKKEDKPVADKKDDILKPKTDISITADDMKGVSEKKKAPIGKKTTKKEVPDKTTPTKEKVATGKTATGKKKEYPRYTPSKKIDPFIPLFRDKTEPVPDGTPRVSKLVCKRDTPLKKVDLSQLFLRGIVLSESGNKALVEDATGKGYVIKYGTPIGVNCGKVVKIQEGLVIVEEKVEDFSGKIKSEERKLELQKPPGEI